MVSSIQWGAILTLMSQVGDLRKVALFSRSLSNFPNPADATRFPPGVALPAGENEQQ